MSHGFMVYAVDIDGLLAMLGCRDGRLRRELRARYAREMASIDEQVGEYIEGACPNTRTALAELIEGEPLDGDSGMLYTYAFKILCMHAGMLLDTPALSPFGGRLLDDLDNLLVRHGVHSVRVWDLAWGSLPASIPEPLEFPGRGHLLAPRVQAARKEMDAVHPAAVSAQLRPGFDTLHGWLRVAAHRGVGIVSFYH